MNFVNTASKQPSKFRTKIWAKINYDARVTYYVSIQITFIAAMLKSTLCDYSDAYILVKGTITVANTGAATIPNNKNIKVTFQNFASLLIA